MKQSESVPIIEPFITENDIKSYCKNLKNRKAPSYDSIQNEHLKYGRYALWSALATLFNLIISKKSIPDQCKRGMVLPIYKENGKDRTDPHNYRPITLLPVIYKLFEKFIPHSLSLWVKENDIPFPHPQQNAYQKHSGPITASFILQETIFHNNELNSDVYLTTLDTKQAFDSVWLPGVFYKLTKLGVKGTMWLLIKDMHTNMSSCVSVNGLKSPFFNVQQGIRQGGVISTWIYNLFINELLEELTESNRGAQIISLTTGSTTLADDICLAATSPSKMQNLLDTVNRYSNRYRYQMNASKSFSILIPNKENKTEKINNTHFTLQLGQKCISRAKTIKHVGILLNENVTEKPKINLAYKNAQTSLYSLMSMKMNLTLLTH